jgi:hypothetical protein
VLVTMMGVDCGGGSGDGGSGGGSGGGGGQSRFFRSFISRFILDI